MGIRGGEGGILTYPSRVGRVLNLGVILVQFCLCPLVPTLQAECQKSISHVPVCPAKSFVYPWFSGFKQNADRACTAHSAVTEKSASGAVGLLVAALQAPRKGTRGRAGKRCQCCPRCSNPSPSRSLPPQWPSLWREELAWDYVRVSMHMAVLPPL
jgi:hypothetical protein